MSAQVPIIAIMLAPRKVVRDDDGIAHEVDELSTVWTPRKIMTSCGQRVDGVPEARGQATCHHCISLIVRSSRSFS